jgi:hypothetical protein
MSSGWQILRPTIIPGDLAATDTDIELTQVIATPADKLAMAFVSPTRVIRAGSEHVNVYGVMYLAYGDLAETTYIAATATIQVIEEAPDPSPRPTASPRNIYAGRAPVTLHPQGRMHTFEARDLSRFSLRISSFVGVGTDHIRVFWKHVR